MRYANFCRAIPLVLLLVAEGAASDPTIAIIVNPSNSTTSIRRIDLDRIYRRYERSWNDGVRIFPVNEAFDSPSRREFSRLVLRQSLDSLVTFWNRRYFNGVLPPPVLKSPQAIRAYVAETTGAIGYIPLGYLDASVKTIGLRLD